jgi:Protein of unknown function (DUF2905)
MDGQLIERSQPTLVLIAQISDSCVIETCNGIFPMPFFILTTLAILAGLMLIGFLADKRAESGDKSVTPGLTMLPGDIKWENQSGNVKVYFPVMSSIVLSIILSLAMRFFS